MGVGQQVPSLEAYGQRGHPGRGCGIDILDALDLGDDLLAGVVTGASTSLAEAPG